MKNSLNGFLCVCLMALGSAAPGGAQQQPDDPQQQQTPPMQQAPPSGQAPAQQQTTPPPPPPQQAPPQTQGPIVQVAPELPRYPDVRMPGESGFWIGVGAWVPKEHPEFNRGRAAFFPQQSAITLQGSPKYSGSAEVGVALGLHNALKVSYFETRAAGNVIAANDITLWSNTYLKGEYLSTNYKFQDVKVSFDYLTWPYPVKSSRFRLRTLWQLQYLSMRTIFDAPKEPLVDATGAPLIDAQGNQISYRAQGSKWFITPTIGVGVAQYVSKYVRIEINGTGFTVPHHWTVWDTDASANFRAGHFELRGGIKAFHYKTSTAAEFYTKNTMISAMFGIRWYSD